MSRTAGRRVARELGNLQDERIHRIVKAVDQGEVVVAGAEHRRSGATVVGPRANELVGAPRELREANDQIDRCIAFKSAKGVEIATALKTAP